jgi:hypothetical protein
MIKFVDDKGQTRKADLKQLLGLKELNIVVVQGEVRRDSNGSLAILARGLYVRE